MNELPQENNFVWYVSKTTQVNQWNVKSTQSRYNEITIDAGRSIDYSRAKSYDSWKILTFL